MHAHIDHIHNFACFSSIYYVQRRPRCTSFKKINKINKNKRIIKTCSCRQTPLETSIMHTYNWGKNRITSIVELDFNFTKGSSKKEIKRIKSFLNSIILFQSSILHSVGRPFRTVNLDAIMSE